MDFVENFCNGPEGMAKEGMILTEKEVVGKVQPFGKKS